MARSLHGRVVLVGGLVFDELVHVGGTEQLPGFDAPPVRDGLGRYVVPGTSLLGVLRSWYEANEGDRLVGADVVASLFGETGDGSRGAALVTVDDVVLDDADVEVIDGVGIDRFSGGAANHIKFDRTALRQKDGSAAPFRLTCSWGGDVSREIAESVVRLLAGALHHGHLRVGSATSRGFGSFTLRGTNGSGVPKLAVETLDRTGVIARLQGATRFDLVSDLVEPDTDQIVLRVGLEEVTSTFVKASLDGTAIDTLPRVVPRRGNAVLVVPATSVKGVLRSEVERLVRTVRGLEVTQGDPLHEQVRVPLVDEMFGYTSSDDSNRSNGQQGRVRFTDLTGSPSTSSGTELSWEKWSKVERCATEPKGNDQAGARARLVAALASAGLESWQPTDHVAIDRWTSGAADKKLFSVLEPHDVRWGDLEIRIDAKKMPGSSGLAAVAGLVLALQALHEGSIGLGWGINRGHGSLRVSSMSVTSGGDLGEIRLAQVGAGDNLLSLMRRAAPEATAALAAAWREAVSL